MPPSARPSPFTKSAASSATDGPCSSSRPGSPPASRSSLYTTAQVSHANLTDSDVSHPDLDHPSLSGADHAEISRTTGQRARDQQKRHPPPGTKQRDGYVPSRGRRHGGYLRHDKADPGALAGGESLPTVDHGCAVFRWIATTAAQPVGRRRAHTASGSGSSREGGGQARQRRVSYQLTSRGNKET